MLKLGLWRRLRHPDPSCPERWGGRRGRSRLRRFAASNPRGCCAPSGSSGLAKSTCTVGIETGIAYADESHFERVEDEGWPEQCAARRDALGERLMLSSKLAPVGTLYGRVTECAVIGNLLVSGDDRRTHTRLVVEIEPKGYRS